MVYGLVYGRGVDAPSRRSSPESSAKASRTSLSGLVARIPVLLSPVVRLVSSETPRGGGGECHAGATGCRVQSLPEMEPYRS